MKIKNFFILIYNKIIGDDIDTKKYMIKQKKEGKPILDPYKKDLYIQSLKKAPMAILKESWIWLLVIIFAFAIGTLVGNTFCEIQCHNFIVEEYIRPQMLDLDLGPGYNLSSIIFPNISVPPSNISNQYSEKEYSSNNTISN